MSKKLKVGDIVYVPCGDIYKTKIFRIDTDIDDGIVLVGMLGCWHEDEVYTSLEAAAKTRVINLIVEGV